MMAPKKSITMNRMSMVMTDAERNRLPPRR